MSDYLKAYRARLERNDATIRAMAEELKKLGCTVKAPRSSPLLSYIKVEKEDGHCLFGFSEVPYGWSIDIRTPPSRDKGSGKTVLTKLCEENTITPQEILNHMAPTPKSSLFLESMYSEI